MSAQVRRIFVEKKPGFDIEARGMFLELKENLGINGLQGVRLLNRYDVAGLSEAEYQKARDLIFAEPPVDVVYEEGLQVRENERVFAVEYLPGQYDQRADSAAQCIQILTQQEQPRVLTARVFVLQGDLSEEDLVRIKNYTINPVDSREAGLEKPVSLEVQSDPPADVEILQGFIDKDEAALEATREKLGLAMSFEDLCFCQRYFKEVEHRNPTFTEIKVIDTYWSDHCRHTTFLTAIDEVNIEPGVLNNPVREAYRDYLQARSLIYGNKAKAVSLMDIATIGMKQLKKQGLLADLDESEEINACSIVVKADVNGREEDWLVMFKNETHNHPTEIEPFGGAATCLGGAIRDPLSGRVYVYQAMRVTGSGDPRVSVAATLPGKLPQRKITIGAAAGYSAYGNQIGLATGQVAEVYDEGFVAKRMEIGAVIGAAPRENVVRSKPQPGDVIVLLGGRTGRDGCGGATGSSKEHTEESILNCGAEVQKGNPPTERKLQRLFRNPRASTLIKKCNDFGAGGISVAIGELADGLAINLDAVPKKYEGLDGTELAISESQERMAVVLAPDDLQKFIDLAGEENLEATAVATVTDKGRLQMHWRGKLIVDISRDFLNTNGVKQHTRVTVAAPANEQDYFRACLPAVAKELPDLKQAWLANLQDLNVCSQKGLSARFDSTIGAATVLMPYGGKYQATPAEGMVAKLPLLKGETNTCTIMTYGYNPGLAKWSPFHGAVYAVVEAVAKVVALGGKYDGVRLSLQEYFEKLGLEATKWGKPFSALLGAYLAQKSLGVPAIGGKDSMSGTFKELHVPPTLVAFAVCAADARQVISQEFKHPGSKVILIPLTRDDCGLPDFQKLTANFRQVHELMQSGQVLSAAVVKTGGLAATISKMCLGNKLGFTFDGCRQTEELFAPWHGSLVLELAAAGAVEELLPGVDYQFLGNTCQEPVIRINGVQIALDEAQAAWEKPLAKIFPASIEQCNGAVQDFAQVAVPGKAGGARFKIAKPRVLIPVFPGTNCEYDSARAFEQAGGRAETLVIKNLTPRLLEESIAAMVKKIKETQIIMLPGGFSAGDEPDGSGKFIATFFRNPRLKEAVMNFLKHKDGLMLGICNGFQALIKLGLLPYGEISDLAADSPTLTFNKIGRHVSCMSQTKVVSTLSPWFSNVRVGDIHTVAISHGEGRFIATESAIAGMAARGQIATQYVDFEGKPSCEMAFNPNGSMEAIEGITSPDGRIFGKMGHSERIGLHVAVNVPGEKDQRLFAAGVAYFN